MDKITHLNMSIEFDIMNDEYSLYISGKQVDGETQDKILEFLILNEIIKG